MRNRNVTRVRWDASERALLVQKSQVVLAARPGDALKDVIAEAMLSLPPDRRRKVDPKTVTWVRDGIRALPPLARALDSIAAVNVPEEAPNRDGEEQGSTGVATVSAISSPPPTNPLATALIDSAVEVLVGILSDARLRMAVRALMSPAAPQSSTDRKSPIVVAGLLPADTKAFERTYADMLLVRFWSSDQSREQLEEYAADARLVIGMPDQLTQAIDSSLSRLGNRYIRNQGGIQGLHKRLADEAMR